MKNSFKIIEWKNNPSIIPQELKNHGGVYRIAISKDTKEIEFLKSNPYRKNSKDNSESYCVNELEEKYNKTKINNKVRVIYYGKASKNLRRRLNQYMKYLYGKGIIHRGGRAVGQIKDFENILICKYEIIDDKDPECYEKELLSKFKCKHGDYPFANWRL